MSMALRSGADSGRAAGSAPSARLARPSWSEALRIRQVKPAFWADARVSALPPAARLFYIGLWMQADDAGWLRWDTAQIANELFGYESRARRERNVTEYLGLLQQAERVVLHPCGHALIPTLTVHQRQSVATKRVLTYEREHADCNGSPPTPAETRGNPPTPAENPDSPPSKGKGKGKGNVSVTGTERKVNVKGTGSAPANTPDGAGATITDETNLPDFLRVVQ